MNRKRGTCTLYIVGLGFYRVGAGLGEAESTGAGHTDCTEFGAATPTASPQTSPGNAGVVPVTDTITTVAALLN